MPRALATRPFRIASDASSNGRKTPTAGMRLSSIGVMRRIHSALRKLPQMEAKALWVDCFTTAGQTNPML